jgi:hypothetical protein
VIGANFAWTQGLRLVLSVRCSADKDVDNAGLSSPFSSSDGLGTHAEKRTASIGGNTSKTFVPTGIAFAQMQAKKRYTTPL